MDLKGSNNNGLVQNKFFFTFFSKDSTNNSCPKDSLKLELIATFKCTSD